MKTLLLLLAKSGLAVTITSSVVGAALLVAIPVLGEAALPLHDARETASSLLGIGLIGSLIILVGIAVAVSDGFDE